MVAENKIIAVDPLRQELVDISISIRNKTQAFEFAKFQIPEKDWHMFTAVLENFMDDPDWHKW